MAFACSAGLQGCVHDFSPVVLSFSSFSFLPTSSQRKFRSFPPTGIGTTRGRRCPQNRREPPLSSSGATVVCFAHENLSSSFERAEKQGESLLRAASIIGLFTIASKAIGLLRETLLAAVFGVGPIMAAFSYSSILPGFFMTILGGINGPLHVTMVAILSKHESREGQLLVGKVSSLLSLVCGGLALAVLVFAGPIIDMTAPGLLLQGTNVGRITRDLAILQLKIMAPSALLAGMIGLGYGSLSAAGIHGVASLSPILSSLSVIVVVVLHTLRTGFPAASSENLVEGAILLASGVTFGAFAQWLWQSKAQHDAHLSSLPFRSGNPFNDKKLYEVLELLLPAVVGSGMLQFATLTDLYFASFMPGAAAGLGYANLLVMAPLGILSSSFLLPMLSLFARLAEPSKRMELKCCIGEGLLLVLVVTLPMTAILVSLCRPIVEIVLQRLAFDASASALVSSLLACYAIGAPFYAARDLLTQVFYALGDGRTPFCISLAAVLSNAFLDWILVRVAALGPNGLVLATAAVNVVSVLILLLILSRKLFGLPLENWPHSHLIMVGASILCGVVTHFSYKWWIATFAYFRPLQMAKVSAVLVASLFGLLSFYTLVFLSRRTMPLSIARLLSYELDYRKVY